MMIGWIVAACCSGRERAQIASRPLPRDRTPVAVTSPVPSSKSALISSSGWRAYGSSRATAVIKKRSFSRREMAPPCVPSRRSAKWRRSSAVYSRRGLSMLSSFPCAGMGGWPQARLCPAAQDRPFGCDQAAPDTVLAEFPVPQRERQALGAHRAGRADGDRSGRLLASLACLGADREPLVGVKAGVSAPGVPDDPGSGGLIGGCAGDQ